MIFKAAFVQTKFLLKQRGAVCAFYILLSMVLANFIGNVFYFQGRDVLNMYQPMKLLLLSYNRTNFNASNTLFLIQIYPLLVVCPAGFSLAREYQRGTQVFLASRVGNFTYKASKYLAAFLTTALVFSVPFLIEIFLNCVSFPLSAEGDLWNLSFYNHAYQSYVDRYLFKNIYFFSPYVCAVAGTLFFGAVSGLMGVFTVAVSSLVKIKYQVMLFLPAFIILNLSTILGDRLFPDMPDIKWYNYLLIFNDIHKNVGAGVLALAVLMLFIVAALCISAGKDCL